MFRYRLSSVSRFTNPISLTTANCSNSARTFQHQKELPQLPIPDLNETCDLYLKTIIPLADKTQFEASKKAVEEFRNNQGPILQKRLVNYKMKHNNVI